MGGRIASHIVEEGAEVAGLALFAYPLHPLRNPERRRNQHLPSIAVPTLFCSGTNDPFAAPAELQEAARLVPHATVHLLRDADHGFSAPKASGRPRDDVYEKRQ